MKAEYVQRGEILDYTNQTGKTIEAGEVVVFGNRIAVAGTNHFRRGNRNTPYDRSI